MCTAIGHPIATSIAFFGMSALRQERKGDLRTNCGLRTIMTTLDHLMIARAKTSNNIIQNGLAFPRKQSASVTSSG